MEILDLSKAANVIRMRFGMLELPLSNIVRSSITPILKKLPYQVLQFIAKIAIKNLYELREKINNEPNEEKRINHIDGFNRGITLIRQLGSALNDIGRALEEKK